MMRIWVSAVASVAFEIKHILGQNFELTQTQALLELWIQWVQICIMLEEV